MAETPPSGLPTLELERSLQEKGCAVIAGVDEVGRGSLAGPLVAAAVVLPLDRPERLAGLSQVRDSKQLSAAQREALFDCIRQVAAGISIAWTSHHIIDECGIAEANRQAMFRALRGLSQAPQGALIDYVNLPDLPVPQLAVPRGDCRSLSIAAASIVAKVFRDRWMMWYHRRYPAYFFASNKGYGTPSHLRALRQYGPSPIHRRSFAPVSASRPA